MTFQFRSQIQPTFAALPSIFPPGSAYHATLINTVANIRPLGSVSLILLVAGSTRHLCPFLAFADYLALGPPALYTEDAEPQCRERPSRDGAPLFARHAFPRVREWPCAVGPVGGVAGVEPEPLAPLAQLHSSPRGASPRRACRGVKIGL